MANWREQVVLPVATLLTEMVNCLPNHNAQDDEVIHATDRFSEVRQEYE